MAQPHNHLSAPSHSKAVRESLSHPVIDSDGHLLEVEPVLIDYLNQVGGSRLVKLYEKFMTSNPYDKWHSMSLDDRRIKRTMRPAFWFTPAKNTIDRATAMLPGLFRSRLDEIGVDVAVLYPTQGLAVWRMGDPELRLGTIRAMNCMHADLFKSYGDRLIPAAIIPMQTPTEALDELNYAVEELGMTAIMIEGAIRRPFINSPMDAAIQPAENKSFWIDTIGIDSIYNYDSVWQKCVELKVSPTVHTGTMGWGARCSISNYNYNHIGHFAAGNEAVCKSLFMGGVTRRFPSLRFGFLEGGVGWACSLLVDLIEHWEKRNIDVIKTTLDPDTIDREYLVQLFREYGDEIHKKHLELITNGDGLYFEQHQENLSQLDEWRACEIEKVSDIGDLFISNFYFGCEADDRIAAWAFDTKVNPLGSQLRAMFSSDVGHWDVTDSTTVLASSYRFVQDDIMTEENFKDFVFCNAVSLYGGLNKDFFTGTTVEEEATTILSANH